MKNYSYPVVVVGGKLNGCLAKLLVSLGVNYLIPLKASKVGSRNGVNIGTLGLCLLLFGELALRNVGVVLICGRLLLGCGLFVTADHCKAQHKNE